MINKKSNLIFGFLVLLILSLGFVVGAGNTGVTVTILEEPTILLGDKQGGNDISDNDGIIWATLTADTNAKNCEIKFESTWETINKNTLSISHAYSTQGEKTVYYRCSDDNSNYITVSDTINIGAGVYVKCYNNLDWDCNDGNVNTEDVCNNAGTANSFCTNAAIACFAETDCGVNSFTGGLYCKSEGGVNKVYKDYQTFTCNEPGKSQSTCSNTPSPILQETCATGCENGVCISNTAPSITSAPATDAVENKLYTYQVTATDKEQTKLWFTDNSPLFNINSLTGLISFTPTKTNVGTHSVTITVSDGWLTNSQTYTLTISGVNNPPVLTPIGALTAKEDKLFEKVVTAKDTDNDVLTFSDDTNLFNINPSTGLISFTPTKADIGTHKITIDVSDGKKIVSENIKLTVIAKDIANTAPSITSYSPLEDVSITELEEATFTVKATDKESTTSVSWYADSTLVGGGDEYTFVGNNLMGKSNAGVYTIKALISDGELTTQKQWTLTVTRVKDTDGDGVADEKDNCVFVVNPSQVDSNKNGIGDACEGNRDGDFVPDAEDFVAGTTDAIDSNIKLNFSINGNDNLNRIIMGVQPVTFTETIVNSVTNEVTSEPIINFNFDFTSTTTLDLSKIEITKQSADATAGEVIVKGIDLTTQGITKTVYMDKKANTGTICIKDAEIASIKEISGTCTGTDEHLITCNGVRQGNYKCTTKENKYKVEGLTHSGLIESVPSQPLEKEDVWYNFLGTGIRALSTNSWDKATCNPTDCVYNKKCYPAGSGYPGRIGTNGKTDTICASNYNNEQGVWVTCRSNIDKTKVEDKSCLWGGVWDESVIKEDIQYNIDGKNIKQISTGSWDKATCNPTDCIYNKKCYPAGSRSPQYGNTQICASDYNNEKGVWVFCRSNIDKMNIENKYCSYGGVWLNRILCDPEYGYTEGC